MQSTFLSFSIHCCNHIGVGSFSLYSFRLRHVFGRTRSSHYTLYSLSLIVYAAFLEFIVNATINVTLSTGKRDFDCRLYPSPVVIRTTSAEKNAILLLVTGREE